MTPTELVREMLAATKALDAAQRELERRTEESAGADRDYRKARATAFLDADGTVAEREARADLAVEKERYRAHLSEALAKSALEKVRNVRAILSALQSMASALREEAAFSRTGPGP